MSDAKDHLARFFRIPLKSLVEAPPGPYQYKLKTELPPATFIGIDRGSDGATTELKAEYLPDGTIHILSIKHTQDQNEG